ncbi:MAG: helix-turn-helix transcriptional regulator [Phycisphaerae bacterium]|nr:helix-turn-helix transcriptional regulator [Phycisphaerae bacterium]
MVKKALASKSGLPQSHISRLEAGRHSPSHKTLEKLASALAVPVNRLDPSY